MFTYMKIILAFVFVSIGLIACTQRAPEPLRLGTNVWAGYEPLYLARDIGALPETAVRLVEYPSASEVIRAFRNRSLEMASLTLDEVLLLVQDEMPLKVILVHDISNGADSILARPGINSMKDIVGKRVAVESGALGAYVMTRALELHGLAITDITIKHLDVNAHEKAYDDNKIDVLVNFEPVRTRMLNKGAKEIFTSKEMYGEIVDVLVVHKEVFEQNKHVLKNMVDGWFKALSYFETHKQQAATSMAGRLNVTPQEVIASFDGLELPDRDLNKKMLGGDQPELKLTINRLGKVLRENKLLARDIVDASLLSDELL